MTDFRPVPAALLSLPLFLALSIAAGQTVVTFQNGVAPGAGYRGARDVLITDDIFHRHAKSREARMQVESAASTTSRRACVNPPEAPKAKHPVTSAR